MATDLPPVGVSRNAAMSLTRQRELMAIAQPDQAASHAAASMEAR